MSYKIELSREPVKPEFWNPRPNGKGRAVEKRPVPRRFYKEFRYGGGLVLKCCENCGHEIKKVNGEYLHRHIVLGYSRNPHPIFSKDCRADIEFGGRWCGCMKPEPKEDFKR